MSCNDPIFVDDIGTTVRITVQECVNNADVPVDVSGQSAMSFIFKEPDGVIATKTPSFTTDGTDGQLEYVILAGDLDKAGAWAVQAEVTLPSGTWRTAIATFRVLAKLE